MPASCLKTQQLTGSCPSLVDGHLDGEAERLPLLCTQGTVSSRMNALVSVLDGQLFWETKEAEIPLRNSEEQGLSWTMFYFRVRSLALTMRFSSQTTQSRKLASFSISLSGISNHVSHWQTNIGGYDLKVQHYPFLLIQIQLHYTTVSRAILMVRYEHTVGRTSIRYTADLAGFPTYKACRGLSFLSQVHFNCERRNLKL